MTHAVFPFTCLNAPRYMSDKSCARPLLSQVYRPTEDKLPVVEERTAAVLAPTPFGRPKITTRFLDTSDNAGFRSKKTCRICHAW